MILKIHYMLVVKISGIHAHLSKCCRGRWPEKVWEPLNSLAFLESECSMVI